jgi:Putative Ig domain/WD40-like Beta Propeller Repeat
MLHRGIRKRMIRMKSLASALSIIALGFGLLACSSSGGGGGGSTSGFAVSTTSADYGVVDNAYTSTLATTGGTAPFTWTLFGGALPTNLTIDQVTGVVSGTPTAAGNFTATFTVTDNTGQTATGSVLFAIHPRTDVVSTNNSTPPVPGGAASSTPSISSDGRFVAFASSATLIPGISGSQIYIHDWQTNQTSLVSRNAVGNAGNGASSQPSISSNGQFVTFTSASSNLTGDSNPGQFQIFLRDTQSNTTTLVSQATGGAVGDGASNQPSISSNGQFVTFTSLATNLAATPGGSGTQIFLRDTQANTTSLVSRIGLGNAGDGASNQPSISSNGQFVTFTSLATNLAATPGGSGTQIFLRDTQANTTSLVSQTAVGGNAGNGASSQPAMSDNDGFVAFQSLSTNLGAIGGNQQIYVRALP